MLSSVRPLVRLAVSPLPAALGAWAMRQRSASSPCIYFHRGSCRFGDFCKFSHDDAVSLPGTLPFHERAFTHAQAFRPLWHRCSACAYMACAQRSLEQLWAAASVPAHARVRVLSYNILADHLAHEHAAELYNSSPRYALEWGYRRRLIEAEISEYLPDVVCLQEVDHFRELQQGLEEQGYEGLYTKRTGDRQDGLATFWRRDVFRPVRHERILFNQLGLKDNVAQIVLLQRRQPGRASSTGSSGSGSSLAGQKRGRGGGGEAAAAPLARHLRWEEGTEEPSVRMELPADDEGGRGLLNGYCQQQQPGGQQPGGQQAQQPLLAVGNIHVLFNPRRGDIKLAQVRTLFEHVQRVCQEHGSAPAVICGDFNSAAGSPIYHYISSGTLDLSQHERRRLSGQVEAQGKGWPSLRNAFLAALGQHHRQQQQQQQGQGHGQGWQGQGPGVPPHQEESAALESVLSGMPPYDPLADPYCSLREPPLHIDGPALGHQPPQQQGWQQLQQYGWQQEQQQLMAAAGGGAATAMQPALPLVMPPPYPGSGAAAGLPSSMPPSWHTPPGSSSYRSGASSAGLSGSSGRASRGWTLEELQLAMGGPTASPHFQHQQHSHGFLNGGRGSSNATPQGPGGRPPGVSQQQGGSRGKGRNNTPAYMTLTQGDAANVALCPLRVRSAYAAAAAAEPLFTTCHDKFIGTVDYIWYTPPPEDSQPGGSGGGSGSGGDGGQHQQQQQQAQGQRFALRPLSVLLPPSLQSLRTGMPCGSWPSDHVSLVADFALVETATAARPAADEGEQQQQDMQE